MNIEMHGVREHGSGRHLRVVIHDGHECVEAEVDNFDGTAFAYINVSDLVGWLALRRREDVERALEWATNREQTPP